SKSSRIRKGNFTDVEMNFDHEFICDSNYESRNKLVTAIKVFKALQRIKCEYVIYPGWELVELIPFVFLKNDFRSGIVIESSILESKTSGLVWLIKKLFIRRMSIAFPSGFLQNEILIKSNYMGVVKFTHGVGLPIRKPCEDIVNRNQPDSIKYLYVGRLSPEKNLEFLIEEFNNNGKLLTIVGEGELFSKYKAISKGNIAFTGYIDKDKLVDVYKSHDAFVLPSKSEPWGLVVEEALSAGLPVIVSSNVGCYKDLVTSTDAGVVFNIDDSLSFKCAIEKMEKDYNRYRNNAILIDFEERDRQQIEAYIG
ncbi:glycosyltransferase, partial [Vibrio vulnificus]